MIFYITEILLTLNVKKRRGNWYEKSKVSASTLLVVNNSSIEGGELPTILCITEGSTNRFNVYIDEKTRRIPLFKTLHRESFILKNWKLSESVDIYHKSYKENTE